MTADRLPILILQHQPEDGPAYLATWLRERRLAYDLRQAAAGDPLPETMTGHAALAVLGGAMSANDDLPMLRYAERLICDAVARQRPVIGHCLGGQLMARALGGSVRRADRPEIGWHRIDWTSAAHAVFGAGIGQATVFQWHFDTFDPPPGALRLASSASCVEQAFAIGPHLAMQFHVELDAAKLAQWTATADAEYEQARLAYPGQVQTRSAMHARAGALLQAQQALAAAAYDRWLAAAGFA